MSSFYWYIWRWVLNFAWKKIKNMYPYSLQVSSDGITAKLRVILTSYLLLTYFVLLSEPSFSKRFWYLLKYFYHFLKLNHQSFLGSYHCTCFFKSEIWSQFLPLLLLIIIDPFYMESQHSNHYTSHLYI